MSEYYKIKLDDFQLDIAGSVLSQLDEFGQSGLEVMTSGGKTYIAGYIIFEYVNNHRDQDVMWIAPKSAIQNVRDKVFSKMALRNQIKYVGYEELARGNLPDIDTDNISLIVFDECHKALANKTFMNLKVLLSRMPYAYRLAMSATPIRYNGVDVFSVLVPDIDKPIRFSITDASEHNLLPKMVYVIVNTKVTEADFLVLAKYKQLVAKGSQELRDIYNQAEQAIKSFNFDIKVDIGKLLQNHVCSTGESGERHIAFFSNIDKLREMKDYIQNAFQLAYPNCTINLLEYHSKLSDSENNEAFKQFVIDEPEPYRIDVLLSVDKATESIHPDNVKSIMMFRGTKSLRIYLQQLGRGVMLKSYHPDDIVVFDFAENIDCLSFASNKGNNTVASVRADIIDAFGYKKGFETRIGVETINKCIRRLNEIDEVRRISFMIKVVKRAIVVHNWLVSRGERVRTENIHTMMHNIEEEVEIGLLDPDKVFKFKSGTFISNWQIAQRLFTACQKSFLYSNANTNKDSISVSNVLSFFESLGHAAYLLPGNGDISSDILNDIDYISNNLDDIQAKYKLRRIISQYAKNAISDGIKVYAQRCNVQIDVKELSFLTIEFMAETDQEKEIVGFYSGLNNKLTELESGINLGCELSLDDWIECKVWFEIASYLFIGKETSSICRGYLVRKFGYILDGYRIDETTLNIVYQMVALYNTIQDGKLVSGAIEELVYTNLLVKESDPYIKAVYKVLGVDEKEFIGHLKEHTEFYNNYCLALNNDDKALDYMLIWLRACERLSKTDERAILLRDPKLLELCDISRRELTVEKLKRRLHYLCYSGIKEDELYEDLQKALDLGIISQDDIVLAPLPSYGTADALKLMNVSDEEFESYKFEDVTRTPLSAVVIMCGNIGMKKVISNLLDIPCLEKRYKDRLQYVYQHIKD